MFHTYSIPFYDGAVYAVNNPLVKVALPATVNGKTGAIGIIALIPAESINLPFVDATGTFPEVNNAPSVNTNCFLAVPVFIVKDISSFTGSKAPISGAVSKTEVPLVNLRAEVPAVAVPAGRITFDFKYPE
jgi:hypothetical protein